MSHGKSLKELYDMLSGGIETSTGATVSLSKSEAKSIARLLETSEHAAGLGNEGFVKLLADEIHTVGDAGKVALLEDYAKTGVLPSMKSNPLAKAMADEKTSFAELVTEKSAELRPQKARLEGIKAIGSDLTTGEDVVNAIEGLEGKVKSAAEAITEAKKDGGIASQALLDAKAEAAEVLDAAKSLASGINKNSKEEDVATLVKKASAEATKLEGEFVRDSELAEAAIKHAASKVNAAVKSFNESHSVIGAASEVSHAGAVEKMTANVADAVSGARTWVAKAIFNERGTTKGSNVAINKFSEGFDGIRGTLKNAHGGGKAILIGGTAAVAYGGARALGLFGRNEQANINQPSAYAEQGRA